jgi:predicted GIY-YIG superfamily endonuclease
MVVLNSIEEWSTGQVYFPLCVATSEGEVVGALLTLDQARTKLGVGGVAVMAAVDRGDLIQVEMEVGNQGKTRKYITAASVDAWIGHLNGAAVIGETANHEGQEKSLEVRIGVLAFHLKEIADKVDAVATRLAAQRDHHRSSRLRHTVSSRIGDAFDPHGYYVYLLWGDSDQTPLYIGQSQNVLGRLGDHMRNKDKRFMVTSIQLIKCSGEATMKRTEAALIKEYNPPMNTVGCLKLATALPSMDSGVTMCPPLTMERSARDVEAKADANYNAYPARS